MKQISTFIFLIISFLAYSQSNFDKGFYDGFKKGYCYERDNNCIAPITPNAPIPSVNENSDNYNHGYNRGFQIGLDKSRNEKLKTNTDNNY